MDTDVTVDLDIKLLQQKLVDTKLEKKLCDRFTYDRLKLIRTLRVHDRFLNKNSHQSILPLQLYDRFISEKKNLIKTSLANSIERSQFKKLYRELSDKQSLIHLLYIGNLDDLNLKDTEETISVKIITEAVDVYFKLSGEFKIRGLTRINILSAILYFTLVKYNDKRDELELFVAKFVDKKAKNLSNLHKGCKKLISMMENDECRNILWTDLHVCIHVTPIRRELVSFSHLVI